jgi:hypothetical protein
MRKNGATYIEKKAEKKKAEKKKAEKKAKWKTKQSIKE